MNARQLCTGFIMWKEEHWSLFCVAWEQTIHSIASLLYSLFFQYICYQQLNFTVSLFIRWPVLDHMYLKICSLCVCVYRKVLLRFHFQTLKTQCFLACVDYIVHYKSFILYNQILPIPGVAQTHENKISVLGQE